MLVVGGRQDMPPGDTITRLEEAPVDTKELKKMLAGVGIASLLTGVGVGAAHAADQTGGSG